MGTSDTTAGPLCVHVSNALELGMASRGRTGAAFRGKHILLPNASAPGTHLTTWTMELPVTTFLASSTLTGSSWVLRVGGMNE